MSNRDKLAAAFVLALASVGAAVGSGAFAGSGTVGHPARRPFAKYERYPLTRGAGLDPAAAVTVFRAKSGLAITVVRRKGLSCLDYSDGTDSCASDVEVRRGHSLSVVNYCAGRERGQMTISGLAPPDVARVTLVYDDRSSVVSDTRRGVFEFDLTTPSLSDPTPVSIHWSSRDGAALGTHPFPIPRNGFCRGT